MMTMLSAQGFRLVFQTSMKLTQHALVPETYYSSFDAFSHLFNRLAYENAKDIIACGFDVNKTFIFSDMDYIQV